MNLVLTMAGKYQRFKLFGNKVPKYLMPLGSRSVLWHIIKQYIDVDSNFDLYLVANEGDRDFEPAVASIIEDFSVPKENLIYINDTTSQLETAASISKIFIEPTKYNKLPIAFTNIDTVLKGRESFFNKILSIEDNSGLVDSFLGNSHEYSYVMGEHENTLIAKDIVDKNKISSFACSGLYGFGSYQCFLNESQFILKQNDKANFTDLYKSMISRNLNVHINKNEDFRNTIVLGTPEEYITNLHKF